MIAAVIAILGFCRDFHGLGTNGALACSAEGEPIRQELIRRRGLTQAALCRRLEQARTEGDLPQSADCAILAAFVMTLTQGMAVQAKAGAPRAVLDAIVHHALATWPLPPTEVERAPPSGPARRAATRKPAAGKRGSA